VGRRSREPWVVSGSNISQVRVSGSGHAKEIWAFDATQGVHAPEQGVPPVLQLSLPCKNRTWYTGLGDLVGFDRAVDGAALRLPPQDDPTQPTLGDPAGAEYDRMQAVKDMLDDWLDQAFDRPEMPWRQQLTYDPDPDLKGRVETPILNAIWT